MTQTYDTLPEKPRPPLDGDNREYWNGLREHRLLIQRCLQCEKLRHYPRPMCDSCYSLAYDWQEIGLSGTVYSWTVSHHPFHPGFKAEVPYVTITAELEAGVRLQAPLVDSDANALSIGAPLVVEFRDVDDELSFPCVRLTQIGTQTQ